FSIEESVRARQARRCEPGAARHCLRLRAAWSPEIQTTGNRAAGIDFPAAAKSLCATPDRIAFVAQTVYRLAPAFRSIRNRQDHPAAPSGVPIAPLILSGVVAFAEERVQSQGDFGRSTESYDCRL